MPQIPDIKTLDKGMNKDVDIRLLQPGEYVDAQNLMNSNYADSAVGSVTNYNGVFDHEVGVGSDTVIGLFKDNLNDELYYFIAGTDRIVKFTLSNNTPSTVVSSTHLGWTATSVIKSLGVSQGILVWTDGEGEIGMFDTNVTYGTITADMLTLAQVTPLSEPAIELLADTNFRSNNIVGKFFQFKYRFVFKNKMRSVFSPISNVAFSSDDYSSPSALSGVENKVNAIDISMSGANSNGLVESIEVAARSGNNGDFFMIKEIEADATFLAGGLQAYRFFNEGLYDPISLQESNQIFDDIPMTAGTLEFANNRVVAGNCRNGYGKIDVDYDIDVIYNDAVDPETAQYDSADSGLLADATYISDFGGTPTPRAVLSSSVMLESFFRYFGYTTLLAGDTISVTGLEIPNPSGYTPDPQHPYGYLSVQIAYGETWASLWAKIMAVTFYDPYTGQMLDFMDIASPPPTPPVGNDKFVLKLTQGAHSKTFKGGAWYNIGLQYQDIYGRTNGVQIQEESKVYIKTLGERGLTQDDYTGAGAATIQVTINNADPSWAVSKKVVYSRASVYDQSLQIATRGAQNNADSAVNLDIDIGSIMEWNDEKGGNLAYVFEKGDRIRVLTAEQGGTNIFTDWAQSLIEAEIVSADSVGGHITGGYAITIPQFDGLSRAQTVTLLNTGATIEIFRPSKELEASQSIYTEANYVEGSSDTISGDAYLKSRDDFPYGVSTDTANIAFESYDISDFSESEHYDKGRATAIINQEESQRIATLMYSEVIIPNTEINQLNRFYPDVNFEEYNKTFGTIIHLFNEGDHLLMMQLDKVSKVYVDKSVMYDGKGNNQILSTQKRVLSESVPYSGVYGIHDPRSFQAIGNRRYWLDASRGVALRLSANGIEEISRYGMRGWFADTCKSLLQASNKSVYGMFDVNNDSYIIAFDDAGTTLSFDEKSNRWITFITLYQPKYSVYINNRTFFIETDDLFEMNYAGIPKNIKSNGSGTIGSAVTTIVDFASSLEPTSLKNYFAILLNSSHSLDVTIDTEALYGGTGQQSTLDRALDFIQREQEFHAAFLRDINTPNVSNPLLEGDTIKGFHAKIKLTLPVAVAEEDMRLRFAKIIVSKG